MFEPTQITNIDTGEDKKSPKKERKNHLRKRRRKIIRKSKV